MIVIQPVGRLGNHMFQFAFGYAMSKRLKTKFIFNTSLLEEYFELGTYNNPIKKRVRNLRYKFSLKFNKYSSIDLNRFIHPKEIMDELKDNQIIYGYFQSELFWVEYKKQIRNNFTFQSKFKDYFKEKYHSVLSQPYICLNMRLAEDYKNWIVNELGDNGEKVMLPIEYYKKVLRICTEKYKEYKIVITADDINMSKSIFFDNENIIYSNDAKYKIVIDYLLISNANVVIASNSSFCWWACYLSTIEEKVIYAPKYWLGHKVKLEYPAKIIPNDWIQIEVD